MRSFVLGPRARVADHRRAVTISLVIAALVGAAAVGSRLVRPAHASGPDTVSNCTVFGDASTANTLGYWLAHYASGDTINFSCSGTLTVPATISIGNTLTIDGSGQAVVLDGGHSGSVTGV